MASQSTILTAKTALFALLNALPCAAAGVQIAWSWPGPDVTEKESIYMGPAEEITENVTAMRTKPHVHDETYTVPVSVNVAHEGNDAQEAETRMWALVAEVEDALRLSPDLGNGVVFQKVQIRGKDLREFIEDTGRGFVCHLQVSIHGRSV